MPRAVQLQFYPVTATTVYLQRIAICVSAYVVRNNIDVIFLSFGNIWNFLVVFQNSKTFMHLFEGLSRKPLRGTLRYCISLSRRDSIWARSQNCEKRLLASSCLSVRLE